MNWQMGEESGVGSGFGNYKESKVKLSLEMRNRGEVIIVRCQGRIVYRDEAASLARVAGEVLQQGRKLVLDLSGVNSIDSAGIGELALSIEFTPLRSSTSFRPCSRTTPATRASQAATSR